MADGDVTTRPVSRPGLTYAMLAKAIDHSLLRPELTTSEVEEGIALAQRYDVASVCVRPCDVPLAAALLDGADVKVGTTIGFPHGGHTTATKAFEARDAVQNGARELDMVLNIGWLRSGREQDVRDDIAAVVEAAGPGILIKVILENAYLDDAQKRAACRLVGEGGAQFAKTSTGFAPTGATLEDLALMREAAPPHVAIKAAGGIRTLEAMLAALDLEVTRVGATATAAILDAFLAGEGRGSADSVAERAADGY